MIKPTTGTVIVKKLEEKKSDGFEIEEKYPKFKVVGVSLICENYNIGDIVAIDKSRMTMDDLIFVEEDQIMGIYDEQSKQG